MAKLVLPNEELKCFSHPDTMFDYLVSKSGQVFRVGKVRISAIRLSGTKTSRRFFNPMRKNADAGRILFFADEMVAKCFLPPPIEGQILIHLDNDYSNHSLDNLKWGYPSEHVFLDCEWKWIDGFEGKYLIDINGKVYSINGRKIGFHEVVGSTCSAGYHAFSFRLAGQPKKDLRRHTLVAKAWIANPENKPQVNHINGIKGDDRVENLEWVTILENITHAVNTGLLDRKGEKHESSKLTQQQVLNIREMASNGVKSPAIHKFYPQVSQRYIRSLINRDCWAWLKQTA